MSESKIKQHYESVNGKITRTSIKLRGVHDEKKRLDGYYDANGDSDALLLRIVNEKGLAPEGGWPSMDVALDNEGARALFNWLGVWLHTR